MYRDYDIDIETADDAMMNDHHVFIKGTNIYVVDEKKAIIISNIIITT